MKAQLFISKAGPLIPLFIILVFLTLQSCATKQIDPSKLKILEIDKEETRFSPSPDELTIKPRLLLTLITDKGETVTDNRLKQILRFIHSGFSKHGNFSTIPEAQVDILLSSDVNRKFQPGNVADAIQMGKSLKAAFVAQLQIIIQESRIVDSIDQYKSRINVTVFTTDSGQVVFRKDILFDTNNLKASLSKLKYLVQEYFQLRGYILETRGGRQIAKISIGRSLGIKQGRRFQVRKRIVENEIINGIARKTISFSPLSLATVTAFKVMENESWVKIRENDRGKIKKGQVVFSQQEKK